MILIVLTATVVVIYLLLSWKNLLKERRRFKIKGPTPLPLLGNAHLFIVKSTEFLNLLKRLSTNYGDIYLVYLLTAPYVVLSHPKFIEPIVTSSESITKGKSYDFLRIWLGQGLLTSTGERWRSHRKLLTPAFHFNILQNFFPVFCKNGRILTEKLATLADGTAVNLFPIIALAALDNVTEAVMGVSADAQKKSDSEYVKSIETLTKIISLRMQVPIISDDAIFNLLPYKRAQDKALHCLHSHTRKVIEARKRDLNQMDVKNIRGSDDIGLKNKYAFLDLLLLTEVDGKKIDEESVREEVDTFMFEGHDTTTSGIVFSLFCISKYPDIQDKIYEEQRNIFEDDIERHPSFSELNQMKYLELVIKESLRLYPSVPLIERRITKETELHGMTLLPGTSVTINIFQMQRHPDLFHAPLEFRPERFDIREGGEVKNPFSYLAFSAGPRNCIGQKFAMMEMKVTLSEIIRKFTLLPADIEPQLCADLIIRSKNGVNVKFQPRKFVDVKKLSGAVAVHFDGGIKIRFEDCWLRDNCRCPSCYNAATFQRAKHLLAIPESNIKEAVLKNTELFIEWDDGHDTTYTADFLIQFDHKKWKNSRKLKPILWRGPKVADKIARVRVDEFLDTERGPKAVFQSLLDYGVALIDGVEATVAATEKVCQALGGVQHTLFGGMWRFTTVAQHADTAYTNLPLAVHNDSTYFTEAAGLQVLHCIEHLNPIGGETILVDGFFGAEHLRDDDPESFAFLTTFEVEAEYLEDGHHHRYSAPVVAVDRKTQDLKQIRFNVYDRSAMAFSRPDECRAYYRSLRKLGQYYEDSKNQWQFKLSPGTVLVMDNFRVLHGRTGFSGQRVLCGSYVARSDWLDKARNLRLIN